MATATKTRKDEMAELRTQAMGVLQAAKGRSLTVEERAQVDAWQAKADELWAEQAAIDRQRAELAEWELKTIGAEPESKALVPFAPERAIAKTVGELVTASPGFAEYKIAAAAVFGRNRDQGRDAGDHDSERADDHQCGVRRAEREPAGVSVAGGLAARAGHDGSGRRALHADDVVHERRGRVSCRARPNR